MIQLDETFFRFRSKDSAHCPLPGCSNEEYKDKQNLEHSTSSNLGLDKKKLIIMSTQSSKEQYLQTS